MFKDERFGLPQPPLKILVLISTPKGALRFDSRFQPKPLSTRQCKGFLTHEWNSHAPRPNTHKHTLKTFCIPRLIAQPPPAPPPPSFLYLQGLCTAISLATAPTPALGEVLSLSPVGGLLLPLDYSLPGSSVHGISQARTLEWTAISFSRGSSQPRDPTSDSGIGRQIPYQ